MRAIALEPRVDGNSLALLFDIHNKTSGQCGRLCTGTGHRLRDLVHNPIPPSIGGRMTPHNPKNCAEPNEDSGSGCVRLTKHHRNALQPEKKRCATLSRLARRCSPNSRSASFRVVYSSSVVCDLTSTRSSGSRRCRNATCGERRKATCSHNGHGLSTEPGSESRRSESW